MNVLVVSDNVELICYFKYVVSQDAFHGISFEYRYTISTITNETLEAQDVYPINMKEIQTIDHIIETFSLVFSLHCKQIFPAKLVQEVKCINIHPGYNPYNRGWYPQVFSLINKFPSGATIHLMDEDVDHGDILFQKKVMLLSTDTSLTAYRKVIEAEKILIKNHLIEIINNNYQPITPADEGNYNGIKDFEALCQLDLNNKATLSEHLDLLRSLTHGDYKNAWFVNEEGKKVYVTLSLREE